MSENGLKLPAQLSQADIRLKCGIALQSLL